MARSTITRAKLPAGVRAAVPAGRGPAAAASQSPPPQRTLEAEAAALRAVMASVRGQRTLARAADQPDEQGGEGHRQQQPGAITVAEDVVGDQTRSMTPAPAASARRRSGSTRRS